MSGSRIRSRTLSLVLTCCWLSAAPLAQETGNQPAGAIRSLSPETVESILSGAEPDVPVTLTVANRDIVTLRASVLGRSSAARAAAGRRLIELAEHSDRTVQVAQHAVGRGMVISLDGQDTFAIVPTDADALVGETIQSKTDATVSRLQQALEETLEGRR